jgi:hypothetical protein
MCKEMYSSIQDKEFKQFFYCLVQRIYYWYKFKMDDFKILKLLDGPLLNKQDILKDFN